jgi:DNA-binding response OmpR family regulator
MRSSGWWLHTVRGNGIGAMSRPVRRVSIVAAMYRACIAQTIAARVRHLPPRLEPDPAGDPRCIRTVRNGGYLFVPGG